MPGVFETSLRCPDPSWWTQAWAGDSLTSTSSTGWTLVSKEAFFLCPIERFATQMFYTQESYWMCPADPEPERFRWLPNYAVRLLESCGISLISVKHQRVHSVWFLPKSCCILFLTCVFPVFPPTLVWDRVFSARFQIVAPNGALTPCC